MKHSVGFTLLEVVIAIAIVAILLPVMGIVFYQLLVVPPDQSARLTLSDEISQLAATLYQDGYMATNFSVGNSTPGTYPHYYGNFSWTDYTTGTGHIVSYYYTNTCTNSSQCNHIVRQEQTTVIFIPTPTPSPTPSPTPTPTPAPTPVATPVPPTIIKTTYTFASTSNKSAANSYCSAGLPSPPTATCSGASWSAAGSSDLTAIASPDNNDWETRDTSKKYQENLQRYFINISENPSNVSRIDVNWLGYGDDNSQASGTFVTNTSIYNYTSSSWTQLSSKNNIGTNTWFNGSITSNCPNYFTGQRLSVMAAAQDDGYTPCPRMYVWDGNKYQFVDSAASGHILKRLSGTNYPATDALVPIQSYNGYLNGYYNLMAFSPAYETSYIDKLSLWAVDHPQGTEIISDETGTIHTVREPKSMAAVDSYGNDVTSALSARDGKSWNPDITHKDFSNDSQLQDWIELTLPNIPKVDNTVKLIVDAHYNYLSLLQLWSYYVYILGSPNEEALMNRVETDPQFAPYFDYGLYSCIGFQIEVWNGSDWVHYKDIKITDGASHIALLNLSDIQDRIRLSVPAGAFAINYVAVDYTADEPVTVTKLQPVEATEYFYNNQSQTYSDSKTQDVLNEITDADGSYAIMHLGDYISYKFEAVYDPTGYMVRSFVLPCTGYYYTEGPEVSENKSENWPLMEQITYEPLAFVKWVYPIYVDWLNKGTTYPANEYDWAYAMQAPFPAQEEVGTDSHSVDTDYIEVKITYTPNCTLNTSTGSGGNVTNPGIGTYTYSLGTVVNINATPNSCYAFVNWSNNTSAIAGVTANSTTITMNNNYSIQANFALPTYNLSVTANNPGGSPYFDDSNPFNCGASTTIHANPSPGSTFVGWNPTDGIANANAGDTTVLMSQNRSLRAYYTSPTPTPIVNGSTTRYLSWHITVNNFSLTKSLTKTASYIVVANITAGVNTSMGKYLSKQSTIYIKSRPVLLGLGRGGIWGDNAIIIYDALTISGQDNILNGNVYVDGAVSVTDSGNIVGGTLYNHSRSLTGYGTDFTVGGNGSCPCPSQTFPSIGAPQDYFQTNLSTPTQVLDDIKREYVFPANVSLTNVPGVWQNTNTLKPGYYYCTGTLTLSGLSKRGSVTFIAPKIVIENTDTGQQGNTSAYIGLKPYDAQDLLLWSTGSSGNNDIWIKGADARYHPCVELEGILFAPSGEVQLDGTGSSPWQYGSPDLPGISARINNGGIMAHDLTITGHDWWCYRW